MSNIIQLPIIAGVEITTDAAGRFNLNALHRASGGKKKDGPTYWMALNSTAKLIEELRGLTTEIPVVTNEGRYGGTYVHELLAISYAGWISPAFQLKVNQVFIDYRTGNLRPAIPQTLPEALKLAAEAMEQRDRLKPKAEALDRIASSDGSLCITDAAKSLQMRPRDLFRWLDEHDWIYRRAGCSHWVGYSEKLKQGCVEHKVTVVSRTDGSEKTTEQVRVTPKGLVRLAREMNRQAAA